MAKSYEELLDVILECVEDGFDELEYENDELTAEAVEESANTDELDTMITIYESVDEGVISMEEGASMILEFVDNDPNAFLYMTEAGVDSNALHAALMRLKKIKDEKPGEYAGPREIKEFITKHYDEFEKIVDCVDQARKEGAIMGKEGRVALISLITGFVGCIVGGTVGGIAVVISFIALSVAATIYSMKNASVKKDVEDAEDDFAKIKNALKKLNRYGINVEEKEKISSMISRIEDFESDLDRQLKRLEAERDREKTNALNYIAYNS